MGRITTSGRLISLGRVMSTNRSVIRDFKSSIVFNGTTSYVDLFNPTIFNATTGITLAAWINPLNNNCRIINKDATGLRSYIFKINASNQIEFDFFSGGALRQLVGGNVFQGKWQHVCVTYDGSTAIVYINGKNVAQNNPSGQIDVKATNLNFGRTPTSVEPYAGKMTELYFKASALTTAQVTQLYQGVDYSNPDGLWKCDETQGLIINDSSGNSNHGLPYTSTPGNSTISYSRDRPSASRILINPVQYIADNFFDTDGTPISSHTPQVGGVWTQTNANSFWIQASSLQANRKTDGDLAVIDCGQSDYNLSASLTSYSDGTNASGVGLVFRYVDASNFWYCYIDSKNNVCNVYNVASGVSTLMINQYSTINSSMSYLIKLKCKGNNITLFIDNIEIVTVVSSINASATKIGMRYGKTGGTGNIAIWKNLVVELFTGLVLDWPQFTEYVSNPVIPLGGVGSWDHKDINNPNVVWDPNNNVWQMYYSGYDGDGDNIQEFGLASATNLLGPWTKNASNPILTSNGTDGIYAWNGGLIYWNGLWYNYYCSNNATKIRVATSPDLVTWTRQQIALDLGTAGTWDSGGPFDGFARIRQDGNTIELWYAAQDSGNTKRGLGYATSTDGLNFTRNIFNPVFVTPSWANVFSNIGEPSIYVPTGQEGKQMLLSFDSCFTTGNRFISQAITIDGGKTWHYRVGALNKDASGWASTQNFDSFIMVNSGTMYLFHSGADLPGTALALDIQIGVATYTPLSTSTLIVSQ